VIPAAELRILFACARHFTIKTNAAMGALVDPVEYAPGSPEGNGVDRLGTVGAPRAVQAPVDDGDSNDRQYKKRPRQPRFQMRPRKSDGKQKGNATDHGSGPTALEVIADGHGLRWYGHGLRWYRLDTTRANPKSRTRSVFFLIIRGDLGITPELPSKSDHRAVLCRQALADLEEAFDAAEADTDAERRCRDTIDELEGVQYQLEAPPKEMQS
jgi:hypothetical protein